MSDTHSDRDTSDIGSQAIIIIGAGWSGLACAVTLADQGYKVCLLESNHQTGGRARKVRFKNFLADQSLDNGQHIMLGAYHSSIALFKQLGIKTAEILQRQRLEFNMYSPENSLIQLKVSFLPAPLHLLTALMKMKGLNRLERFIIIKMALKLTLTAYKLKDDISVSELLKKHSQTTKTIAALWEPLCLATMNTPIKYASAQVFLNVLKDSFNNKNDDSDLLFFRQNLSRVFCEPAADFINQHGGMLKCGEKVTEISYLSPELTQNQASEFLIKTNKSFFKSHTIVLATPAHISRQLLQRLSVQDLLNKQALLKPAHASLDFQYEPICTIYLQYPASTRLPQQMVGLFNSKAQWAIDRSLTNQSGLIAVIISGPGEHIQMTHKLIADTVHQELCLCVCNLPPLLNYQVITEKRATFSCRVNIEQQRPVNETNIPGLFLAGDYTDTHYPSTLEGAIRSGQSAAKKIIEINPNSHFTL